MSGPLLIVGTERSGSNLLRLVLDAHRDVHVPHPPHLLHYLAPLEGSYGDLRDRERRRRLARDLAAMVEGHIHPWPFRPDVERLVAEARPPDLVGLWIALYEQAREQAGKPRWGCKSTFVVEHLDRVAAALPEARFLWLVRDPRDVAASSRESVFNPCHPLRTARLWARQQAAARAALERHGPGRVHLLRYEDLVSEPERVARRVCDFADLPWDPAMLDHAARPAARAAAALSGSWRLAGQPVQRGRVGRWRRALSAREAALVEGVCAAEMRRLGYPLETSGEAAPSGWEEALGVPLGEFAGRLRVELRSLREDRNHWLRWRRGARVRRLRAAARLRALGAGPAGAPGRGG